MDGFEKIILRKEFWNYISSNVAVILLLIFLSMIMCCEKTVRLLFMENLFKSKKLEWKFFFLKIICPMANCLLRRKLCRFLI